MNKELEKFLKENNCYEQYMNNTKKALENWGHTNVNKAQVNVFANGYDLLRRINGPFIWNDTPEGATFWLDIHEKYLKYVG